MKIEIAGTSAEKWVVESDYIGTAVVDGALWVYDSKPHLNAFAGECNSGNVCLIIAAGCWKTMTEIKA